MSTPELQALLANLRPRSQASVSNLSRERSREPSASFLTTSNIPSTPPPPFSPAPSQKSPAPAGSAIAQNLLNLLNFHQSNSPVAAQSIEDSTQAGSTTTPTVHQHQIDPPHTADQAAKSSSLSSSDRISAPSQQTRPSEVPNISSANAFPDLLHRAVEARADTAAIPSSEVNESSTLIQEQQALSTEEMVHGQQIPHTGQDKPLFTYKNPFEALKASRTTKAIPPHTEPQSSQQPASYNPPDVQNISFAPPDTHNTAQAINEVVADRVKLTPKSRTSKPVTQHQSGMSNADNMISNTSADRDVHDEEPSTVLPSTEVVKHDAEEDRMIADPPDNEISTVDGSGRARTETRLVPVLSFPVKAFVSITLQPNNVSNIMIREDGVMEISRLKKDFDQIDRSLAVASSRYIAYAFVKNGGMRIIRQDDGSDRHVFKNSHDRVFNIALSTGSMTAPPSEHQAVLGTGISGAVYYATICRPGRDMFDNNELPSESLIFPAHPQADENTAGGTLKTRAKRSSRHPDFFAIGRGKAIHIIWPATAMSARYGIENDLRTVNVEKYFAERPLQILTGKAGKDFTFSEDDTMIVSLDKTGRLRFWDIRKLIDEENSRSVQITPYIIDTPILSLSTASPAEKSWPTSVLFVDKARPYTRGGPLRYVLVGLRQNHTLQLWDIALGKAVQEINFPHESETDGICSVSYHPGSGIIAVGHPTRNSIFFIHLSAPRYTLSSSLSQASYVQRIAAKDPEIPKPESTACMSGIRELSFGTRGQIRSVELLPVYKQSEGSGADAQTEILFELYVVHSKGVTCLTINREDLGWNAENKVVQTVDAEKEGLVVLKELRLGSVIEETTERKSPLPEPATLQPKPSKKKSKKSKDVSDEVASNVAVDSLMSTSEPVQAQPVDPEPSIEAVAIKPNKKTKKKASVSEGVTNRTESVRARAMEITGHMDETIDDTGDRTATKQLPNSALQTMGSSLALTSEMLDNEIKKIEKTVSTEFRKELEQLQQTIKSDRVAHDEASMSRQEAMLRLVSTTLDNNVEKSLARIIASQMQDVVVPSVVESVSTTVTKHITNVVAEAVHRELGSALPVQLEQTLQSPQMLLGIGNNITQRLTAHIQGEITKTVNNSIASNMKSIATRAASEVFNGYESRIADKFQDLQTQTKQQAERVELINQNMEAVLTSIQTMAQFQADLTKQMQQHLHLLQAHTVPQATNHVNSSKTDTDTALERRSVDSIKQHSQPVSVVSASSHMPAQTHRTQADIDLEEISYLMEQQRYEEGSIKWLQSSAPHEIFNTLFVRYTPDYLATDVSSLVAFSIGVTLANEMAVNTQQRLEWINAAFNTVDLQDREIIELAQHAPQLINGVVTKLETLYVQKANLDNDEATLRSIQMVAKKAQDLKHVFDAMNNARGQSYVVD